MSESLQNTGQIKQVVLTTETLKGINIKEINGKEKKETLEINTAQIKIQEIKPQNNDNNNIIINEKDSTLKSIEEKEDTCEKFPLRCLVFIPFFIYYFILSLYDFLTYLIVPICYCLFYTFSFICNSCKNICSSNQIEEEIGFSGAFTLENDIKIEIGRKGGILHLDEILCFSYMSACVKRYCCFLCVLINHITLSILQGWNRAKKCFLESEIEKQYNERINKVKDVSSYKGYDSIPTKVEIINI